MTIKTRYAGSGLAQRLNERGALRSPALGLYARRATSAASHSSPASVEAEQSPTIREDRRQVKQVVRRANDSNQVVPEHNSNRGYTRTRDWSSESDDSIMGWTQSRGNYNRQYSSSTLESPIVPTRHSFVSHGMASLVKHHAQWWQEDKE